jgi:predicted transcriptional regulator
MVAIDPNGPLTEEEKSTVERAWDEILDVLFHRFDRRFVKTSEMRHIVDEVKIVLNCIKGKKNNWKSVVDVVLCLLDGECNIASLKARLGYSEATIYRALRRLELAGFAIRLKSSGSSGHRWLINKERCPLLYRATN